MGVELVSFEEALRRADFLSIHMAKTNETTAMIGVAELALMKPTARVINAARGGMIDEDALARAVREGRIAGAGVDVFPEEPPKSSPLFDVEQIVVTPHLGASTVEAQDKAGTTIAEQVSLALRGEIAQYAVNVDVGREIAEEIRPFVALAERLGRIFTALSGELHNVRVTYRGAIADHDTRVVTLSALRGMLSPVVEEAVTFVNAPLLAEERGVAYAEEKTPSATGSYVNEIEISGDAGVAVAGTVIGKGNEERITQVYDFHIEMPPAQYLAFLRYDDRPGVIGAIGTILGERGVNIADMRVGRQQRGGEALMCLSVDQPINAEVLDELARGSGAKDAKFIVSSATD
jgi:D-3-phosphoglycerate dehydrogenase